MLDIVVHQMSSISKSNLDILTLISKGNIGYRSISIFRRKLDILILILDILDVLDLLDIEVYQYLRNFDIVDP